MTLSQSITRVALATAGLLLMPLVAMQFTKEVVWTLDDFIAAGILLFGTGLAYTLVARLGGSSTYRMAAGVGVAAGLLLIWGNLAVGFIGSEDNPANLLYGAVLAVGLIGAIAARFRPLGMSSTMFAAALTQVLVPFVAMIIWRPEADPSKFQVLASNTVFAGLWAVSGWLFRRASTVSSDLGHRLA